MNAAMTTDVSVVVATYNRLDSLLWLLNDLGEQKPFNGTFDVVVVDDGSARGVEPEVMARTYSFPIRVLTRTNGGPAVARDAGIRAASGEWIVIVDDDMVIPETFLAAHMEEHERGADVVMGHIRAPHDVQALSLFERFHQYSLDRFVSAYKSGSIRLDGGRLCTGNVSFRRSDYLKVGGFDTSLGRLEDRELGIRFEESGRSLTFSEDAWNEHRSDHDDPATWRRRTRLYGELDAVIATKYPHRASASPWAFLPQLPKISWPAAVMSALVTPIGRLGASGAYRVGEFLDRRGRSTQALQAAAVCYAFDYFAGVGQRLGSPQAVINSVRAWRAVSALGAST